MKEYKHEKTAAIILAGGSGSRMLEEIRPRNRDSSSFLRRAGSLIRKQYMNLLGKPMLAYTLEAFEKSRVDEIYLVISKGDRDFVHSKIVDRYGYRKVAGYATGGAERYHSVYQGLLAIDRDQKKAGRANRGHDVKYVLIHDGARPLITPDLVNRCISQVKKDKACLMAMPAKDTIRLVDGEGMSEDTPPRDRIWIVQTPQCFVFREILDAFTKMMEAGDGTVTDDGMVMERYGTRPVHLFEGSYENIKVTTPDDFIMAEAILMRRI